MTIKDHGAYEAALHKIHRGSTWKLVRKFHLKRQPRCVACPSDLKPPMWRRMLFLGHEVDVHHIIPFHICVIVNRRDLETDSRNLVTLCNTKHYRHHELLGHLGNYGSYCLAVKRFVASMFRGMSAQQIETDGRWQTLRDNRPKAIDKMDSDEIVKLATHIDMLMPRIKVD